MNDKTKRNWSRFTRQKFTLQYYNRVFGKKADSYAEIPENDRDLLKRIPLQQSVLFICADEKAAGLTYAQIAIQYGLSECQAKKYVETYRNARFVED